MALKINKSYLISALVLVGIGAWMGTGTINMGGQASANAQSVSERAQTDTEAVRVRAIKLTATERQNALEVRGRTQADATISVRAETGGIVQERLVELGDQVQEGDVLCRLDRGAREARLLQAKAAFEQAEADYLANATLQERGFAASNRVAALRAALDAASAGLREAELELARTEVKANASGLVQSPLVEVGDLLSMGGVCATLIDTDPMIITGQVSERDISALTVGMSAKLALITGERKTGAISYIAPSADAATRTFQVDIEVPNPNNELREGVTAVAFVDLPAIKVHQLPASTITLDDAGNIGVRLIDTDTKTNSFRQISIVAQQGAALWVTGLPDEAAIITVGQEYVIDGQPIEAVYEEVAQ